MGVEAARVIDVMAWARVTGCMGAGGPPGACVQFASQRGDGDKHGLLARCRFRRVWARWLLALALAWVGVIAWAHQSGNSYLDIQVRQGVVQVVLDYPVRDVARELGLTDPAALDRAALQAARTRLADAFLAKLAIEIDDQPLQLADAGQQMTVRGDGLYVRQLLTGHWGLDGRATASGTQAESAAAIAPGTMRLQYRFFDSQRAETSDGRAFVRVTAGNAFETATVLDATQPKRLLSLRRYAVWEVIASYAWEGLRHIWDGLDHLLFLVCLMIPGLLPREPAPGAWRPAAMHAVKVVTAFTLAHSVTLAAAVMGWIEPPERLVESAIAGSIAITAALNLSGSVGQHHWKLAAGFGLIHGFGFAGGLRELGLSSDRLLESLLGFNLGVEAGQLLLLALIAPLAALLSRRPAVSRWSAQCASVAILAFSGFWFVERLMG
jgi:hypothetical protein